MVRPVSQLLLTVTLLSGLVIYTVSQRGAEKKPNFIIILADDIGWGDLDVNQPEKHTNNTPNLNQMARQGLRLTDYHSPASTCSPSRAAILTGRYGLRNGVTHNFAVNSVAGLPLSEVTLAQLLQQAGYYTAVIGKWHLGHNGPYSPINRGFDYYFGIPYSNDMGCTDTPGYDLPPCLPCVSSEPQVIRQRRSVHSGCYSKVGLPLVENSSIVEQPLNLWALTEKYRSAALRIIQSARARAQPYLLLVASAHMHVPLAPAVAEPSGDVVYAASLRELDGLVGAIKAAADETDRGNTLIWFTGDNGPWEEKCQFAGSVGPFTGKWQTSKGGGSAKRTTWEGGHRVPTVVYWPGRIPANTTSSALLSGMDIFPTVLSLAGVAPPADRRYDGIDASSVLLRGEHSGHEFLFHPNSGAAGKFGDLKTVRVGKHKAFYITGGAAACNGSTGQEQLHDPPLIFDLDREEAEETPLQFATAEYRAIAERVARKREELLWDIATDGSVSTADYSQDELAAPCCDRTQAMCRCRTMC
ncbi:arylsulfatase G [Poeciliopsis prolifica]|uniref:arylsulfatase G n=1 Tax=Poeciliopsis prolifica TaxID=188132 RepID=UPI0024143495|nr:arylsulfatase G [Poeciliopsis prolifica]XP_054877092.1 arylsulfatase G [Poeciliopsis prolifica]XP_054877093.1 arylsulfatase G [Poeciliopsis prolifica]